MNSEDCTLDTPVALVGEKAPLQRGKVAGPVSMHPSAGEVVVVEWTNGMIQKVTLRSLLSNDEANLKEQELLAKEAKLEEEFDKTSKDIAAKIVKAAKLLDEANALAKKQGTELSEMYTECRPLMRAMDAAGWSTSSLGC